MIHPDRNKSQAATFRYAKHQHEQQSRLTTGHFGIGVLLQVSVQDGVADLVADLVCGDAKDGEAGD